MMNPHQAPRYQAMRHCLAYQVPNTDRTIVFDPVEYVLAVIRLAEPKQKREWLKQWPAERKRLEEQLGENALFGFQPFYMIPDINEGGNLRKKDIFSISYTALQYALCKKIMLKQSDRHKARHLWTKGGKDVVRGVQAVRPYLGTKKITAGVHSLTSAVNSDVNKYKKVSFTGLFNEDVQIALRNATTDSRGGYWGGYVKGGKSDIVLITGELAALNDFAYNNPEAMKNYLRIRGKLEQAFLPFNFRERQENELSSLLDIEVPYWLLAMDVLMDYHFNKTTKFEISKKLMKIADIFPQYTVDSIQNGTFKFVAIPQAFERPDIPEEQLKHFRGIYAQMCDQLKAAGFESTLPVVEFMDTEHELTTDNFVNSDTIVRPLFTGKPAIMLYEILKPKGEFGYEPADTSTDPVSRLFKPMSMKDSYDTQEKVVELRIPEGILIRAELKNDYRDAINKNYPGGLDALLDDLRERRKRMTKDTKRYKDAGRLIGWLNPDR